MDTISLDRLHYGHESDPPMNARLSGRDAEVEPLAASLQSHGQIQALTVSQVDGKYYVVDGNRRLGAYKLLAKQGVIPGDHPVRCDLAGGTGLEVSLAANIMRVPMHQADTYVTFRDLAKGGMTEADIAGRFGIERSRVRKMLALGNLATVIIEAWRQNKLDVETVRAFTVAPDLATQERVFSDLAKSGTQWVRSHAVRRALGMEDNFSKELRTLGGLDAYRAAGGRVVEDLFGESHNILDPDLLRSLAQAKVDNTVELLVADGWSWAARADTLPREWQWQWETLDPEKTVPSKAEAARIKKLEKAIAGRDAGADGSREDPMSELQALRDAIKARGYADEIKSRTGCIVVVDYHGAIETRFAVVKPEPVVQAETKAAAVAAGELAGEDDPVEISKALRERLFEQLTLAAQKAIVSDPSKALAALVAAMTTTNHTNRPIGLAFNQYVKKGEEDFASVFNRCLAMRDSQLMEAFAAALSPYIDMRISGWDTARSGVNALVEALDQAPSLEQSPLAVALQEHFDAADYFSSAPRAAILSAIREAVGHDEARRLAGAKKKDLATVALARVVSTGWLPPELRTPSYAGPGAGDGESRAA